MSEDDTAGFVGFAGFDSHSYAWKKEDQQRASIRESRNQTRQTLKPRTAAVPSTRRTSTWIHGVLDAIGSGRAHDGSSVRQCPAHPDAHPSLNVSPGRDGRAVVFCHAGCSWHAVIAAIGIPARYLFTAPPVSPASYAAAFLTPREFPPLSRRSGRSPQSRGYRLAAIHDYGPDHRVLRYRKGNAGHGRKQMFWETRRGNCWEPGLYGTPTSALPLYREPDVRMAVAAGEPVLLVESESSVDALRGWYATTWAGGASSVQLDRIASVLAGYRHLVVIPDSDPAGTACLAELQRARLAPHVLIPEPGEDARDLLTRVGPDEFRDLVNGALDR